MTETRTITTAIVANTTTTNINTAATTRTTTTTATTTTTTTTAATTTAITADYNHNNHHHHNDDHCGGCEIEGRRATQPCGAQPPRTKTRPCGGHCFRPVFRNANYDTFQYCLLEHRHPGAYTRARNPPIIGRTNGVYTNGLCTKGTARGRRR